MGLIMLNELKSRFKKVKIFYNDLRYYLFLYNISRKDSFTISYLINNTHSNNIKNEENLPDFIVDAHDLNYQKRIEMQSVWQKYIDASISSTINLDNSKTVNDIKKLYNS